jgi:hypothetical protein
MKKSFRGISIASLLLLSFIFTALALQSYFNIDPDLGWHLKLGELTYKQKGVFEKDPFSYTMPSYPFIDHEWLTNVVLYFFYTKFGKAFVSVFFTLMLFATFGVSLKVLDLGRSKKTTRRLDLLIAMLFFGAIVPFFGIRPQVISWLMYSVFLGFLYNRKLSRFFYLTPFLVLLWVNLHGSFPLPIFTLVLISIIKFFIKRTIWYEGLVVFAFSLLATGINPYGYRIWYEVFQQITDTSVRWVLVEWMPFFYSFNIFYLVFVALFLVSIGRYLRLLDIELIFLNVVLLLQGIMSMRHIPLWMIVNLPMAYKVLSSFYNDISGVRFAKKRFEEVISVIIWVLFAFLVLTFLSYQPIGGRKLDENGFYPSRALGFLRENPPKGNVFSDYGWGGYLIWNYPEKKVFIDGRMATWKWEANIPTESNYIMKDYVDFVSGRKDIDEDLKKFNVEVVLWPVHPPVSSSFVVEAWIKNGIFKKEVPFFDPNRYFVEKGWEVIYKDNVSSIYRRKE